MFGIGGLTGLPLGLASTDIHLHDTYYVIGHFHYVVAPGTLFALFAGIYYWFPKATGRKMNEFLGWTHFTISFVAMNAIFMPMLFAGMTGMLRRGYDPSIYRYIDKAQIWTMMTSWGAFLLALGQVPFIVNFFWSMFAGKKVESDNPWQATTLEWAAPSPPPHGNFIEVPAVYREPYEYSNPARPESDFWPQFAPEEAR
jgi:cytochrome c oxidase subunit 1